MPTVFAVGAAASSTGAAITPAIPTGTVANDVLLLVHEMDPVLNAAVLGAVTGYAEADSVSPQSQTTGLPTRLTVRWHRATGPESGTVTVPAVTNHHIARIVGIRGCVTAGNPWNVASGAIAASSATVNFATLTTTAADCLIFHAVATGQDVTSTANLNGWTNAALASVAEQVDNWTASGTGGGIATVNGNKATAGSIGTTTATLGTANTQALITLAMQGAVAAAGKSKRRMTTGAAQRASRW